MAKYVDGFLIPIPTKNLAAYKKLAKKANHSQYCMPADGLPWLEREAVLSFEEIERFVAEVGAVIVQEWGESHRFARRAVSTM